MYYFLDPGFWQQPLHVILLTVVLTLIIFVRYVSVSLVYDWILRRFAGTRRNKNAAASHQQRREIIMAFYSSAVFGIIFVLCFYLYQHGSTKIYHSVSDYPWYYTIATLPVLLIVYESYYYWLHRWMHLPRVFKHIHRVHHESKMTSGFTAFSFHPLEAFLQVIFFPVIVMVMPLHYGVLLTALLIMTLSATVNHGCFEVLSSAFLRRHLISSTHHHVHHDKLNKNFGLYLTWWDRLMNTNKYE